MRGWRHELRRTSIPARTTTEREMREMDPSDGQVRYALAPLLEKGIVGMDGGRGKSTTYFLR